MDTIAHKMYLLALTPPATFDNPASKDARHRLIKLADLQSNTAARLQADYYKYASMRRTTMEKKTSLKLAACYGAYSKWLYFKGRELRGEPVAAQLARYSNLVKNASIAYEEWASLSSNPINDPIPEPFLVASSL